MNENQALTPATAPQQAVAPPTPKTPVAVGNRGVQIVDLESLWRFSQWVAKSGLAPKGVDTPESICIAIEMGLEIGLPPMAAVQNIAVINGRPGVFGDVPLALVRASGLLEQYTEEEVGKPGEDSWGYKCVSKRVGSTFANSTFTVADAKRAQLWGKPGPWSQYPKRMLMFRARGFLLRDQFGDVLKGVKTVEELQEIAEQERFDRAKVVSGPLSAVPPEKSKELVDQPSELEQARRLDDAKAEAAAGLAPVEKTEPKPEPKPEVKAKPGLAEKRTQVAEIVVSAGATYEDFTKFTRGQFGDGDQEIGLLAWDTYSGFDELPEKLCDWAIKAKRGLINALRGMKEAR